MDYSKILQKIKPSEEEQEKVKVISEFVINYFKKLIKDDVDILQGGSSAKGTFLKGDFDVDIFVRYKTLKENYSNALHDAVKEFCKNQNIVYERVHGSRDYFKFNYKKISFEIVPVKYVTKVSEVENVTDMSPLHVKWAKSKINEHLKNDIMLAKQFCKAQRIYGAESYINGFSGHVIDILIIHYNGFENMLKAISSWDKKTIIDTEKKHKDVLKELNHAKIQSPLIIVDPIDSSRNASASVSVENYKKLIFYSKKFLEKPMDKYFIIPKFSIENLKPKENEKLFVFEVIPLEGKKDVIGSKVLKVFEFIKKELKKNDFEILNSDWYFDKEKSYLYFILDEKNLSPTYIRKGPKEDNKEAVKSFKEKHGKIFEENGFMCVELKREFVSAKKLFEKILKDEYITSRVKEIILKD
ncbi:MAG: CCA tRNA nucleotidyltransferase [Candidatus Woesearchaeota archaeon]